MACWYNLEGFRSLNVYDGSIPWFVQNSPASCCAIAPYTFQIFYFAQKLCGHPLSMEFSETNAIVFSFYLINMIKIKYKILWKLLKTKY